jgi:sugar lactone lactonase YvrE
MNTNQIDKEVYRAIINDYFLAFGTGDFSKVQFSSKIQFLSPISGLTMKGKEAVTNFVAGVSTRVTDVKILHTSVDYPNASGVWQMLTTKGTLYTLHNYFRLDEEGLAYIWPMFDPKAVMQDPNGLLEWLRGEGYYEIAAEVPRQPTGVTQSKAGRLFVNFPNWVDAPPPSVVEISPNGGMIDYPNTEMNQWDGASGESARTHFVCVHTVYIDRDDVLWILDPASPQHRGVVPGGAKLVKVNLATNTVERIYTFPADVVLTHSYLNKMRIAQGHAIITDSDAGAIIVLDLDSGKARRLLDNHYSAKAEPGVPVAVDGIPLPFATVHADGIGLDPQGNYIYYKALVGRILYRITVTALLDESLTPEELGEQVEPVAVTECSGGMEFDGEGNLYITGVQEEAIKVLRPDGRYDFFARATNFQWPDTIAISSDGHHLLFTASQLHLMPGYHSGVDLRKPPYKIFRLPLKPK